MNSLVQHAETVSLTKMTLKASPYSGFSLHENLVQLLVVLRHFRNLERLEVATEGPHDGCRIMTIPNTSSLIYASCFRSVLLIQISPRCEPFASFAMHGSQWMILLKWSKHELWLLRNHRTRWLRWNLLLSRTASHLIWTNIAGSKRRWDIIVLKDCELLSMRVYEYVLARSGRTISTDYPCNGV